MGTAKLIYELVLEMLTTFQKDISEIKLDFFLKNIFSRFIVLMSRSCPSGFPSVIRLLHLVIARIKLLLLSCKNYVWTIEKIKENSLFQMISLYISR